MTRSSTLVLAFCLAGCATVATGGRLGGEWRAVDINGVPVSGGTPITLRLEDAASGNSGCNSYSGAFRLTSRQGIEFGPLAVTRIACGPELMDQERRYLSILRGVSGYSFYSDGSLSLISGDGRAVRLRRP
ncbi:MAG: META domain-containing protein [Pseudomonadota bacterium]|nr:META domain-containing protein [Pseudomonadota bacterium]